MGTLFIIMYSSKSSGMNYKDKQGQTAWNWNQYIKRDWEMKDKEAETDRNNGNPLSVEDLIAQCLLVYTQLALK